MTISRLRRNDPRFLVLGHYAMCYDTFVNTYLCGERWVLHASYKSVCSFVLDNLAVLPSCPPAPVELWYVHRWCCLCQHCTQYGRKLREFLATLLHRDCLFNLL